MSTLTWPAQGTTLALEEGNSNTYSLINNLLNLDDAGGGTVAQAKTTNLSSVVHTYRGTIKDPAEVGFSLNFDPTDSVHKFVRNSGDNPSNGANNYQAVFNTGATNSNAIFSANVSEFSGPTASDVEGNLTADVKIKISGATTWTNSA